MIYNIDSIKKYICNLLILFGCVGSSVGYAILDIEITQGVDTAVPIAVYPFSVNTSNLANQDGSVDTNNAKYQESLNIISSIIAADLYRSGLFLPKRQSEYSNQIDLNNLPIANLQEQQVEYLVKGNVNINPYGRYQVSVQLVDLYQALDIGSQSNNNLNDKKAKQLSLQGSQLMTKDFDKSLLINKSFEITADHLRYLAHHISDLIYERLTGIKGVFTSRIAYVNVVWRQDGSREYTLEVADSDGYNPRSLLVSSEPIMSPTWSPDGKRIAYVSFMGNRSKINIVELATGNTRTVTSFKGINGAPSWSPDGRKMALVLSREEVPKIYLLDLADNKLMKLTSGPAIDTEPRWAPDAKSIIFTSNRGGGPQIYKYNLADKKVSRLTYEGNYNARASFTPDGSKLIMIHRQEGASGFNIAVQDLETYNVDILTRSDMDESPSISANGQQIIYATKEGNRGILAEVSIDGRIKIKRPAQIGDVQEPAWSPYLS